MEDCEISADLQAEVRRVLHKPSEELGWTHLPPAEALRRMAAGEAEKALMPCLLACWRALRAPAGVHPDDHALELFRGDGGAPTLDLIRENPEDQLAVVRACAERLVMRLYELNISLVEAGLIYAVPGSADVTVADPNTGELRNEPTAPTPLQDSVARWFNRCIEHVRGYRERLEQLVHHMWRERDDAMVSRQQRDDLMLVAIPKTAPKDEIQRLILFLTEQAHARGYSRHAGFVYSEKVINGPRKRQRDGTFVFEIIRTCAWEQKMELRHFITQLCARQTNEWMWGTLHSQSSSRYMDRLLDYFENDDEPGFPRLNRESMRGVYSFRDGVYACRNGEHGRFYPYGSVPMNTVACKYIDENFMLEEWDGQVPPCSREHETEFSAKAWTEIPTPALQHILDSQELPQDVCCWVYAFLGRMLYALGEKDRWQIAPFVKGVAGSGKSTLGQLVKLFYDPSDVGILSNNIQKQFGLWDLYQKLVCLCFEVKHDFRLSQAELQSIISGEEVCIARKCRDSVTCRWKTPIMLMGNEGAAAWGDASGSISRRLATIKFDHRPMSIDPDLPLKIKAELPQILLKVNMAYLSAVEVYGRCDIWAAMPAYFRQTQSAMKENTNPMVSYLNQCAELEYGDGFFVTLDDMSKHFREFCRQGGWSVGTRWTEDLYQQAFEDHDPKIVVRREDSVQYKGRTLHNVKVAYGVKIDSTDDQVF